MEVLLQCDRHFHITAHGSHPLVARLNLVTDPKKMTPGGETIEGRMQRLCEAVAEDIKECANACDAYLK